MTIRVRSFPDERPRGPRRRLQELSIPTRRNGCNDLPSIAPPGAAPSRPEPTAPDAFPSFSPRNPPTEHTPDGRRRLSDPVVGADKLTRGTGRAQGGDPPTRPVGGRR